MSIMQIGERWKYPDAKYKKKKISTYIVEMIYGTQRGAMIRVWQKADKEDVRQALSLPHIFSITRDHRYRLVDEIHFMYWQNAQEEYFYLKKVGDVLDLVRRNQ